MSLRLVRHTLDCPRRKQWLGRESSTTNVHTDALFNTSADDNAWRHSAQHRKVRLNKLMHAARYLSCLFSFFGDALVLAVDLGNVPQSRVDVSHSPMNIYLY